MRATNDTPTHDSGNPLLMAALDYAKRCGWLVFPCAWIESGACSCKDPECDSPGKHPLTPHGLLDATTDPECIRDFWTKLPRANVAILTGAKSGIVALDLDNVELAKPELKRLLPNYDFKSVPIQKTGKGFHLIFHYPGEHVKTRTKFLPGMDSRGDGGYIMAAPSLHVSGRHYEWKYLPPANDKFPPLPIALLTTINGPSTNGNKPPLDLAGIFDGVSEGQRDEKLFRALCKIRSQNLPEDFALKYPLKAPSKFDPPFPERLVFEKVKRVYSKPEYAPRNGDGNREEPRHEGHATEENSHNSRNSYPQPDLPKPELRPEALYGLVGDIVRTIEPYSESDPVAILSNLLVGFGNVVGPTPFTRVEETYHHLNFFVVQVGNTSKGRKGQAMSTPRKMFRDVDVEWSDKRITGGLSSGEGLIYNVRDPRYQTKPIREDRKIVGNEDVLVDKGEDDKRLLLVEEEFSQALKVMSREGNILSPIIRQAWDHGNLRSLTKNDPNRATGAHISIIAHITRGELLRHLVETEQTNGFGNRFCWLLVSRSKEISRPKGVPPEILDPLTEQLREAVAFARRVVEIDRDERANNEWDAIYHDLSEAKPGLTGALIARAEAQVLRLSCLYALLDKSEVIRAEHQQAALALWEYSEQSVAAIFGWLTGDPNVDTAKAALRAKGELTLTELHALFGHHATSAEIDRVIAVLVKTGLAVVDTVADERGRKSITVLRWTAKSANSAKSTEQNSQNTQNSQD